MSDAIQVTITDPDSGEVLAEKLLDNDYLVVCAGNRYVDGVQAYPTKGTVVVTIKRSIPEATS